MFSSSYCNYQECLFCELTLADVTMAIEPKDQSTILLGILWIRCSLLNQNFCWYRILTGKNYDCRTIAKYIKSNYSFPTRMIKVNAYVKYNSRQLKDKLHAFMRYYFTANYALIETLHPWCLRRWFILMNKHTINGCTHT